MRFSVIFSVLIFSVALARAELKWDGTTIETRPPFGAKQAVGHFQYKNVGPKTVRITMVHASCGCTATQLTKNLVEPGESGEITATFTIGDRTGTQLRDVTVQSTDPDHGLATTKLFLKTVIAPPIEIQPALVYWNTGEAPKPKIVMVNAAPGSVKSIHVIVSDPAFRARFDSVGDGQFKITVQPVQTEKTARATIKIQAEGSPKVFSATAVVTGKAAAMQ